MIGNFPVIGWIIILFPGLLGLLGLRAFIRDRFSFNGIAALFVFIILSSISIFLLFIFDSPPVINARMRYIQCGKNLESIAVSITQYKKENRCFPSSLENLYENERVPTCCPKRDEPSAQYQYKKPQAEKGNSIICWDSKPHKFEHMYLKFLSTTKRNVLRIDGTIESLSEEDFNIPS